MYDHPLATGTGASEMQGLARSVWVRRISIHLTNDGEGPVKPLGLRVHSALNKEASFTNPLRPARPGTLAELTPAGAPEPLGALPPPGQNPNSILKPRSLRYFKAGGLLRFLNCMATVRMQIQFYVFYRSLQVWKTRSTENVCWD